MLELASFLLVKPDGVEKGVVPVALRALEKKVLTVVLTRRLRLTELQVGELYGDNANARRVWGEVVENLTSGESILLGVCGENAIDKVIRIKGKAKQSGLRLQFTDTIARNAVHCPDDEQQRDDELIILKV